MTMTGCCTCFQNLSGIEHILITIFTVSGNVRLGLGRWKGFLVFQLNEITSLNSMRACLASFRGWERSCGSLLFHTFLLVVSDPFFPAFFSTTCQHPCRLPAPEVSMYPPPPSAQLVRVWLRETRAFPSLGTRLGGWGRESASFPGLQSCEGLEIWESERD